MTCTLPMEQMQIQIATANWAVLISVQPMEILHHSLLVKAIFLSMKWKCLCLKTFKMGIYALEFMHFFIEKVLSGFALSRIKF